MPQKETETDSRGMQIMETVQIISAGNWYGERDALPQTLADQLTQYRILQYNNVFDKDERVPGVFALTE